MSRSWCMPATLKLPSGSRRSAEMVMYLSSPRRSMFCVSVRLTMARSSSGPMLGRDGDHGVHGGLAHHHDQARRDAVTGDVADQHPLCPVDLEHVVVVAAHLGRRAHDGGHLAVAQRDVASARAPSGSSSRAPSLPRAPSAPRSSFCGALRDEVLEPGVDGAELAGSPEHRREQHAWTSHTR